MPDEPQASSSAAADAKRVVYVLEDNLDVLRSTAALLSSYGYEPRCFSSPHDFLLQVDPDQPGCLLTDYMMPQSNGLEVERALRSLSTGWRTILMTSHAPSEVDQGRGPFTTVLRKPFTGGQLREAIDGAFAILD